MSVKIGKNLKETKKNLKEIIEKLDSINLTSRNENGEVTERKYKSIGGKGVVDDPVEDIEKESSRKLLNRLRLIRGEIRIGNNNKEVSIMGLNIINILKERKDIDESTYKKLYMEIRPHASSPFS